MADNWRGINDSARRISRRQRCFVKSGEWVIGIGVESLRYGDYYRMFRFVGIREVLWGMGNELQGQFYGIVQ